MSARRAKTQKKWKVVALGSDGCPIEPLPPRLRDRARLLVQAESVTDFAAKLGCGRRWAQYLAAEVYAAAGIDTDGGPVAHRRMIEKFLDNPAFQRWINGDDPEDTGVAVVLPPAALSQAYPPPPVRTVIGRDGQADQVFRLLVEQDCPCVTIWGAFWVGKSCLAHSLNLRLIQAGREVAWFDLARETNPARLRAVLRTALGIANQEFGIEDPKDKVSRAIVHANARGRHLVVVLDNIDDLLDSHAASVQTTLLEFLEWCGGALQLLVTCRSKPDTHIDREADVHLLPLVCPTDGASAERARRSSAVECFVSAMRTKPKKKAHDYATFAVSDQNAADVITIVRATAGLPMAIWGAAGRVWYEELPEVARDVRESGVFLDPVGIGVETSAQVLDRLYGVLADDRWRVFRHLGVFKGSWTDQALDAVVGHRTREARLELLMRSLVERASIPQDQIAPRYRVIEPVRSYAEKRLREQKEWAAACKRHAAFYAGLAEGFRSRLRGREQLAAMAEIRREYANLEAALEWATDPAPDRATDPDAQRDAARLALRIASGLGRYWFLRFDILVARHWMERARASALSLVGSGSTDDDLLVARVCNEQGFTYQADHGLREPKDLHERAERVFALHGDRANQARATYRLGLIEHDQANEKNRHAASAKEKVQLAGINLLHRAWELSQEAFKQSGDDTVLVESAIRYGEVLWSNKRVADAWPLLREALDRSTDGDIHERAYVRRKIANLLMGRGRPHPALRLLVDAMESFEALRDLQCQYMTLVQCMRLAAWLGQYGWYKALGDVAHRVAERVPEKMVATERLFEFEDALADRAIALDADARMMEPTLNARSSTPRAMIAAFARDLASVEGHDPDEEDTVEDMDGWMEGESLLPHHRHGPFGQADMGKIEPEGAWIEWVQGSLACLDRGGCAHARAMYRRAPRRV